MRPGRGSAGATTRTRSRPQKTPRPSTAAARAASGSVRRSGARTRRASRRPTTTGRRPAAARRRSSASRAAAPTQPPAPARGTPDRPCRPRATTRARPARSTPTEAPRRLAPAGAPKPPRRPAPKRSPARARAHRRRRRTSGREDRDPLLSLGQLQRVLELALRERALEPGDDLPVAIDRERPRLGRQVVGEHLRPQALILQARTVEAALPDLVAVVDLHVDERRLALVLGLQLLGDVDDRPAHAALA